MKKIINILCIFVIVCAVGLAYADDRFEGEHLYNCKAYVRLKNKKKAEIMSSNIRADLDEQAPGKFRRLYEENGNVVEDPIECFKIN